jgi:hypothetical protein
LLDLTLFGIFKRKRQYCLAFGNPGTILAFVDHVYMKIAKTVTRPRISTAFQAIVAESREFVELGNLHKSLAFLTPK